MESKVETETATSETAPKKETGTYSDPAYDKFRGILKGAEQVSARS